MQYTPFEKLQIDRPVDKNEYIKGVCQRKNVLDIGAYDETAVMTKDQRSLVHYVIASVAVSVFGVDTSTKLPKEGLRTSASSYIHKGSIQDFLQDKDIDLSLYEVVFAGELIEHLPNTLDFLKELKVDPFIGKQLIITTPNGISLYNALLAFFSRESNHEDHLQMYTYKTLHTLCARAEFSDWKIQPYYFLMPEMIARSHGWKKAFLEIAQKFINSFEFMFPAKSAGWIVSIRI